MIDDVTPVMYSSVDLMLVGETRAVSVEMIGLGFCSARTVSRIRATRAVALAETATSGCAGIGSRCASTSAAPILAAKSSYASTGMSYTTFGPRA